MPIDQPVQQPTDLHNLIVEVPRRHLMSPMPPEVRRTMLKLVLEQEPFSEEWLAKAIPSGDRRRPAIHHREPASEK